eukprot:362402-Chlamydomonas_euryale.AAC.3
MPCPPPSPAHVLTSSVRLPQFNELYYVPLRGALEAATVGAFSSSEAHPTALLCLSTLDAALSARIHWDKDAMPAAPALVRSPNEFPKHDWDGVGTKSNGAGRRVRACMGEWTKGGRKDGWVGGLGEKECRQACVRACMRVGVNASARVRRDMLFTYSQKCSKAERASKPNALQRQSCFQAKRFKALTLQNQGRFNVRRIAATENGNISTSEPLNPTN